MEPKATDQKDNKSKPKEPFKGFEEIALCFSGGGYRAACFSLGTLSLFDKIGLLEKVNLVSTVSGGTITGVKYAQSQTDGNGFPFFFKEYYDWLKEDALAKNALRHISSSKVWKKQGNEHKRKNPINAFAIEYNIFTHHRTLGQVEDAIENGKTNLKRVVFNTTDFTHSMGFRFQNSKGRSILGNRKVQGLNLDQCTSKLKLGDILASSSAFPGGFEPIGFPHDFISKEERKKAGLDAMNEIGLMDGGIIDNQGISSILTSGKKYDLYFISDVASPYPEESFKFAQSNSIIKILSYLTSLPILILALGLMTYFFVKKYLILTATFVFLTTVMAGFQFLFYFANRMLKKEMGVLDHLKIHPRRFGYYIFDRITSLLKMTTEVFLKNARRSNYESIYSKFQNKMSTSAIYELRCDNDEEKPENQKLWDTIKLTTGEIPENMRLVATYAASFGTTLWFSPEQKEKGMLDAVVACGEFTACYNLLAFMIRYYPDEIRTGGVLNKLYNETTLIWDQFKKDPYFLLASRTVPDKVNRLDYENYKLCIAQSDR